MTPALRSETDTDFCRTGIASSVGRLVISEKRRNQRAMASSGRRASITDLIVDEYLTLLDESADDISKVESVVLQHPEPEVLRQIFHLKRRLIDFRRSASGMRDVANAIIRREEGLVGDDLDPYFRDDYDHLVRAVELVESQRDLLTGSLDIYLSAVANRTNEVTEVLTIYGTLAVPLVVTTLFRNELASALEQQPARRVVCQRTGSVDRGGALLFQTEAVVLKIGRLWQTAPVRPAEKGFADGVANSHNMKLVGSLRQPPRFDARCGLGPSTVCSSDTYI